MGKVKCAAYCRVSTLLNQDPLNQELPIRKFVEARGFELVQVYTDRGVSGARERRPALDQLIVDARCGKFKVLIVAAIDRIGRSTKHLLVLIDELRHYGVSLISLRENLDFTTPTGQMTLTVLSAVSTLERQILSERVKTAIMVKKMSATKTGWRCGRPGLSKDKAEAARRLRAEGKSIRQIANELGIGKTSVERILKGRR